MIFHSEVWYRARYTVFRESKWVRRRRNFFHLPHHLNRIINVPLRYRHFPRLPYI